MDLLGKDITDLQSNVSVGVNGIISGTLLYLDDYTGFSGDTAEQSGHYLAVKATATEGATITAELIGGNHGPVTLDSDGILIARITDTKKQKLRFTATVSGKTDTIIYSLKGLTLEAE